MIHPNHKTVLEINTTPEAETPTYAVVAKGFSNITEALNEVLYQASDLCDEGWGHSEVMGGQIIVTLTGVRETGDKAQDYIFSPEVRLGFGEARKTTARLTQCNETLTCSVTLAKVDVSGGDSQAPAAVTVEIHFNGKPTLEEKTEV